ncbi:plasmid partitioning protein RepB [Phyllobacterium sp. P30BS-XVII]|uniref:plasmid partitioning protein RepB n=1 Tax=Phyllobacterium sp. P30BS-XVII TaxID=2587046 RepID=UPI0015F92F7A|nr:plasmid partitioning protein RepB [Phyllobacterium sp. P30BS-XVII]MBA8904170.1 ParB family chromosome partitioning protein [Phyllobacterium sp. P30BS-XVII]
MSRKDTLKSFLTRRENELPHGNFSQELPHGNLDSDPPNTTSTDKVETSKPLQHIRSGAVGAMGRSLGQIANAADHARALIASGLAVVDLPTDKLDGSFINDRLANEGVDFDALYQAIKDTGQKSPILVRPHPTVADRYQIAFGHRRVRVLSKLGRTVKAVVQNLTDEELVVIQGQENSARSDLSYIERGLFAVALETRGFDRHVIMSSLGMEKTQLSRLLAIAHSIPRDLAEAIGPAPRAGRPRWVLLAEKLEQLESRTTLDRLINTQEFQNADTDLRFVKVLDAISTKMKRTNVAVPLKSSSGHKIAMISRGRGKSSIVIDDNATPEFADFVASRLSELHQEYLDQRPPNGKTVD